MSRSLMFSAITQVYLAAFPFARRASPYLRERPREEQQPTALTRQGRRHGPSQRRDPLRSQRGLRHPANPIALPSRFQKRVARPPVPPLATAWGGSQDSPSLAQRSRPPS